MRCGRTAWSRRHRPRIERRGRGGVCRPQSLSLLWSAVCPVSCAAPTVPDVIERFWGESRHEAARGSTRQVECDWFRNRSCLTSRSLAGQARMDRLIERTAADKARRMCRSDGCRAENYPGHLELSVARMLVQLACFRRARGQSQAFKPVRPCAMTR